MKRKFLPLYIISVFHYSIILSGEKNIDSDSMFRSLRKSKKYSQPQVLAALIFSDKNSKEDKDELSTQFFPSTPESSKKDKKISLLTAKIEEYKKNQSSIEENILDQNNVFIEPSVYTKNVAQEKIENNIAIIIKNDAEKNKKNILSEFTFSQTPKKEKSCNNISKKYGWIAKIKSLFCSK